MSTTTTPDYAPISGNPTLYDDSLHTQRARQMATINKLPSGAYRVQIRRKGRYASETFLRREDAHRWARQAETRVDQGLAPNKSSVARLVTFGDLVDLHVADMCAVGKPPLRSKAATLSALKSQLGQSRIGHLDRQSLIDFGRRRARMGAGPVTLSIDIGTIRLVLTHAAAVHGLDISPEPVDLARVALKRLGLVGKGKERDRRPTQNELHRLSRFFEAIDRLTIPMTRKICRRDRDAARRNMPGRMERPRPWQTNAPHQRPKGPAEQGRDDQRIPLFAATGYDAWALVGAQAAKDGKIGGRIFPYNPKSVGTAFRRACRALQIEDLHFHDLRHEGTSRLFEAGFAIEQVALVTGHKDWKMLRRYTHLKPDDLHALAISKCRAPVLRLAAE